MLTKQLQSLIKQFVNKSFNSLRLNLLGPDHVPKAMLFSVRKFDPNSTLGANYLAANSLHSTDPSSIDKDTLKKVKSIAENYIDSIEQKSIADLTRIIGEKHDDLALKAKREDKSLREVILSESGEHIIKEMSKQLKEQKDKITKSVDTLVNHELHSSQNMGALDGILGVSKSLGIDDPTICKIGVKDGARCKYCIRLWGDEIPKVYKMSELSGSPGNDYKNPRPSISPTHPNCRDILVPIMPGFGFNDEGKIEYKGNNHDEYEHQKKKS